MHSFEVHSNESACRKSGRLGLEQVKSCIHKTSVDIDMVIICAYQPSQHALTHWKFVLCCCVNCPCIDIPDQESDRHHSNTSLSVCFYVYHLIVRCTVHGRRPQHKNKIYCLFLHEPATFSTA